MGVRAIATNWLDRHRLPRRRSRRARCRRAPGRAAPSRRPDVGGPNVAALEARRCAGVARSEERVARAAAAARARVALLAGGGRRPLGRSSRRGSSRAPSAAESIEKERDEEEAASSLRRRAVGARARAPGRRRSCGAEDYKSAYRMREALGGREGAARLRRPARQRPADRPRLHADSDDYDALARLRPVAPAFGLARRRARPPLGRAVAGGAVGGRTGRMTRCRRRRCRRRRSMAAWSTAAASGAASSLAGARRSTSTLTERVGIWVREVWNEIDTRLPRPAACAAGARRIRRTFGGAAGRPVPKASSCERAPDGELRGGEPSSLGLARRGLLCAAGDAPPATPEAWSATPKLGAPRDTVARDERPRRSARLSTAGARCAEAAAAPATGCCAMVLAEPADAVAVVAIGRRRGGTAAPARAARPHRDAHRRRRRAARCCRPPPPPPSAPSSTSAPTRRRGSSPPPTPPPPPSSCARRARRRSSKSWRWRCSRYRRIGNTYSVSCAPSGALS